QGECGLTKTPRSLRPSGLEALGLERLEPMSFNRDQGFLRFDVAQSLPPRFPSRNIKWMAMAIRFLDRWGAWTGRGVYLLYNRPKNLFGQKTPREGAFNRYCVKFSRFHFLRSNYDCQGHPRPGVAGGTRAMRLPSFAVSAESSIFRAVSVGTNSEY